MTNGRPKEPDRVARLLEGLTRLAGRRAKRNPRVERILLAIAAAAFVIATALAVLNLPEISHGVRWWPLMVLLVIAVPLTVVWNGVEYAFSARLIRLAVPIREALRVSTLSSAANLLPLPGSTLIRIRALSQLGSGLGRAAGSTATIAIAWMATSFFAAGFAIALGGEVLTGILLLAVGVAGIIVVAAMVNGRLDVDRPRIVFLQLLGIELGFVTVLGIRMWLILSALDYDGLDRGFALALAAAVSTAAGFFPGGLGVREILAGVVSPLVGLPPSVGIVTAAIDRVAGLAVLAVIGTAMSVLSYDTSDISELSKPEKPTRDPYVSE